MRSGTLHARKDLDGGEVEGEASRAVLGLRVARKRRAFRRNGRHRAAAQGEIGPALIRLHRTPADSCPAPPNACNRW